MDRWLGITRYATRTLHTVSSIYCRLAAEAREVDDEERRDVVGPLAESPLPGAKASSKSVASEQGGLFHLLACMLTHSLTFQKPASQKLTLTLTLTLTFQKPDSQKRKPRVASLGSTVQKGVIATGAPLMSRSANSPTSCRRWGG